MWQSEDRRRPYIAEADSAGDAVKRAAACRGIEIPDWAADFIAAAAVAFADDSVGYVQVADRDRWEQEQFRDYLRQQMRHKLLDDVTRQGRVPVSLPVETVRHMAGGPLGRCEVPAEAIEQGADWDTVVVTLEVGTRRPPIDREKAVRAGILTG